MLRERLGSGRPGTASVELAIVLPILLVLLAGIWEVGRMVQVQQVLTNAAREGARAASTGARSQTQVDTAVKNYLTAAGIKTNGYTVKVINLTKNPDPKPNQPSDDPSNANQLDRIRVTVTLPFNNVKWLFIKQLTNVGTLSATVEWHCMKDQPVVVDSSMPAG